MSHEEHFRAVVYKSISETSDGKDYYQAHCLDTGQIAGARSVDEAIDGVFDLQIAHLNECHGLNFSPLEAERSKSLIDLFRLGDKPYRTMQKEMPWGTIVTHFYDRRKEQPMQKEI